MDFNLFDHLYIIFISIVVPLLSIKSGELSDESMTYELPPKKHLFYTNGLVLIIGALLVLTSWNLSGRPWSALGFRWPYINTTVLILCVLLVIIYIIDTYHSFVTSKNKTHKLESILPTNWNEFGHFAFLAFSAGICEEIIFRGFFITYLTSILPNIGYTELLAVVIPSICFAISHFYQGKISVIKIFIIAILFGWIFIISGSLLIVIALHVTIDLFSGMFGVLVFKRTSQLHEMPDQNNT